MFPPDSTLAQTLAQHADSTIRQQVITRIDALGQKLGVAVDHIWSVLVRQAYAEAAMRTAFFLVAVTAAVFLYKLAHRWWAEGADGNDESDFVLQVGATLITVATTITLITATVMFIHGIGYVVNPEYFAFERVAEFLGAKGGK